MNKTHINIISNLVGRAVPAALSIIFVPVYLRYVSVEMYGIIGFFSSLQAFLFLLDGGISPTLNREVARLSALPAKEQELLDLSRTLEILCWTTGSAVCLIALIASPLAAQYWLRSEHVSPEAIADALMLMSIALTFQWAIGFYMGGMYGLQEQKLLNVINVLSAFMRTFGGAIVLAYISSTIAAFLVWQLIVGILNCTLLAVSFWWKLPSAPERPRFRLALLRKVWRYAAGLAGTGLVVLILTQVDKLILSKMLTLEDFGYYSLAMTLAGTGIGLIVGSIQTAYFPQFSQLVAQGKIDEFTQFYHDACQVMSFFLIPVVCIFSFFSYEILLVWTANPLIAEKTYLLLTLVAIGTGLNGLMNLPYYAQLAYGITKIGFWQNVVAIIVLVPFMIYATLRWGAVGGALSWAVLNFSYTIFGLPFMHRLILKGELKKWYTVDVGMPFLVAIVINGVAYLLVAKGSIAGSRLQMLLFISIIFVVTWISGAWSIPTIKRYWTSRFFRYE